jgi:hypothetical protein
MNPASGNPGLCVINGDTLHPLGSVPEKQNRENRERNRESTGSVFRQTPCDKLLIKIGFIAKQGEQGA